MNKPRIELKKYPKLLSNSFQISLHLCQNPCSLSKPLNSRKLLRSSGVSQSKRALRRTASRALTASDPQSRHSPVPLSPALSADRAGAGGGRGRKKGVKTSSSSSPAVLFSLRGVALRGRGRVGRDKDDAARKCFGEGDLSLAPGAFLSTGCALPAAVTVLRPAAHLPLKGREADFQLVLVETHACAHKHALTHTICPSLIHKN